jgi:hemerythrin-like domain-containing protein
MAALLNQLRLDHINYARLLNLLEVDIFALESGGQADYLRMKDIMKYMINYPDAFHHPCEEILFDKLHDLDKDDAAIINKLNAEHATLADLGQKVADLLDKAIAGQIMSKEEIVKAASEYKDILRAHLVTEERKIFPLIESSLSPADWEEAAARTGNLSDPIFSGPVAEEYRRLFESISRKEKAS